MAGTNAVPRPRPISTAAGSTRLRYPLLTWSRVSSSNPSAATTKPPLISTRGATTGQQPPADLRGADHEPHDHRQEAQPRDDRAVPLDRLQVVGHEQEQREHRHDRQGPRAR